MVSLRAGLLATALFAVPCQAQTNFLTNPDFESGLSGWSSFGNAVHELANPPQFTPRSGSGMVSLFGQGGAFNVSGIFQTFPANPGDQFTMDAWSRHWGGDPVTGPGAPTANWMIMKMAFFNGSGTEIGGAEATILDGSSPTDVWIDNAPVMGTAPVGTVSVQAFILFLQPAAGLGAGHVDDIFFTGPVNMPTYPGTGEDLLLTTGINGAAPSGGNGNYIKAAPGGQLVECSILSPGGNYTLSGFFLAGQLFATGSPPVTTFPGINFDLGQLVFFLEGAPTSPLGQPIIGPTRGTSVFFKAPVGAGGTSLMLQALVADPGAANGGFAASDGYEIQFQ